MRGNRHGHIFSQQSLIQYCIQMFTLIIKGLLKFIPDGSKIIFFFHFLLNFYIFWFSLKILLTLVQFTEQVFNMESLILQSKLKCSHFLVKISWKIYIFNKMYLETAFSSIINIYICDGKCISSKQIRTVLVCCSTLKRNSHTK